MRPNDRSPGSKRSPPTSAPGSASPPKQETGTPEDAPRLSNRQKCRIRRGKLALENGKVYDLSLAKAMYWTIAKRWWTSVCLLAAACESCPVSWDKLTRRPAHSDGAPRNGADHPAHLFRALLFIRDGTGTRAGKGHRTSVCPLCDADCELSVELSGGSKDRHLWISAPRSCKLRVLKR